MMHPQVEYRHVLGELSVNRNDRMDEANVKGRVG